MINANTSLINASDMPGQALPSAAYTARSSRNPYADHMSKGLREIVDSVTLCPPSEQVMLFAELELTRQAAAQSVKHFDRCMNLPDTQSDKPQLVMQAAAMMSANMAAVADMAAKCSNIQAQSSDKFSVHNLHLVVQQICDIAQHVFAKLPADVGPALALEFSHAVQTHVRIQNENSKRGTDLLPDQTVLDMDATVPSGPE